MGEGEKAELWDRDGACIPMFMARAKSARFVSGMIEFRTSSRYGIEVMDILIVWIFDFHLALRYYTQELASER